MKRMTYPIKKNFNVCIIFDYDEFICVVNWIYKLLNQALILYS